MITYNLQLYVFLERIDMKNLLDLKNTYLTAKNLNIDYADKRMGCWSPKYNFNCYEFLK